MSRRGGVLLYLALAALLVAAARPVEAKLVRLRLRQNEHGYSLAAFAPPGKRTAAQSIFTACLGGMRGIIADLLWMRAIRMEEEGRTYEIVALLDGILQMQPHFTSVWAYQSHVLAFDFGSFLEAPAPGDAYRWVRRGIEAIEKGIAINPTSSNLEYHLALIYQQKLSPTTRAGDRQTWQRLAQEWHKELLREAEAAGRPAPAFDRYRGLKKAHEHYLRAAGKPDISGTRRLLCRRMAVRCLMRMGHWRQAERGWKALLEGLARSKSFGPGSAAYRQNQRFFRQFMREWCAFLLAGGDEAGSREVHGKMKEYFPGELSYREALAEEVRHRRRIEDESGARRLYRLLRERCGEVRSYQQIIEGGAG